MYLRHWSTVHFNNRTATGQTTQPYSGFGSPINFLAPFVFFTPICFLSLFYLKTITMPRKNGDKQAPPTNAKTTLCNDDPK